MNRLLLPTLILAILLAPLSVFTQEPSTAKKLQSRGQNWDTGNTGSSTFYYPGMKAPTAPKEPKSLIEEIKKSQESVLKITKVDPNKKKKSRFSRGNLIIDSIYTGIIPGIRDTLPHILKHQKRGKKPRKSNQLTWIGYQALSTGSRIFIQTSVPAEYAVESSNNGKTITVELLNTRIPLSNSKRVIDTSFFPLGVDSVKATSVKGRVAKVTINLHRRTPFHVTTENEYLYIDVEDGRR